MVFKNIYLCIIPLIVGIVWLVGFFRIFKKHEIPVTGRSSTFSKYLRLLIAVVGVSAWLLLSYAITGPRKPLNFSKDNIEVNDIFLVVDVSRSMLAIDFEPNRLETAKRKIREFVDLKPSDRLGIVIFSEKAFTLLPLTTDIELIRKVIDQINVGFLGGGTNIGDGLGLAISRLISSQAKSKVIVLLTDGVSNVGSMTAEQAAEHAKANKIKIYTIGMGTDGNAKLPVGQGIFGMQYQTIPGGSYDEESLKTISSLTGGRHYLAKNDKALSNVLGEINKLEKTKIEVSSKTVYEELYYKYYVWGILLLILAQFMRMTLLREAL
jgi:Ca-activated chloride channel family protein